MTEDPSQEYERLLGEFLHYVPQWSKALNVPRANILLFGQYGSGKTSFVRNLLSLRSPKIAIVSDIYSGKEHGTKSLKRHQLSESIFLWDPWGLDVGNYGDKQDEFMAEGSLEVGTPSTYNDVPTVRNKDLAKRMHVVILVCTRKLADHQDEALAGLKKHYLTFRRLDIPCLLAVTFANCDDDAYRLSPTSLSSNAEVMADVRKISAAIGLPPGHAFPVLNYCHETQKNTLLELLTLRVLSKALDCVNEDFTRQLQDRQLAGDREAAAAAAESVAADNFWGDDD